VVNRIPEVEGGVGRGKTRGGFTERRHIPRGKQAK